MCPLGFGDLKGLSWTAEDGPENITQLNGALSDASSNKVLAGTQIFVSLFGICMTFVHLPLKTAELIMTAGL